MSDKGTRDADAPPSADSPARSRRIVTALIAALVLGLALWAYVESERARGNAIALAASDHEIAQLRTHVTELQDRIAELQQQAANQAAELREVAKPDMPVTVTFRARFFAADLTATFHNHTAAALQLAAVFTAPDSDQHKEMTLDLPAHGSARVGREEGWPFQAGQHIVLSNPNFHALEVTVAPR